LPCDALARIGIQTQECADADKQKSWAMSESAIIRRKGARPLASLVGEAMDPVTKSRGFASTAVLDQWPEIIGARLAEQTRPIALKWPTRPEQDDPERERPGATLEIAVTGAFALEVQHSQRQILDRINAAFGWRAVEKLKLQQQPVKRAQQKQQTAPMHLTPEEDRAVSARLQKIEDPDLRTALHRLAVGVISRSRQKR
jgi:hypothetical protein